MAARLGLAPGLFSELNWLAYPGRKRTLSLFAFSTGYLGTERVSGKKVTDLFCLSRDVPGNGAGEIGVVRRGAEKSALNKV